MSRRPALTVTYLLADTALFGGTKIVLHQANLMARRGHRVTVVGSGDPPAWYPLEARFEARRERAAEELAACDLCVATYWTTLREAGRVPARAVIHYCQGYEGHFTHNRDDHAAIRRAYSRPWPAMAVSPHLVGFLEGEFGRPARWIPQPLEPFWRPRFRGVLADWLRRKPRQPPRILVASPFEIDWKGVATALEALARLRRQGFEFQLVRLSQWPLTETEGELLEPDEFHHHLEPGEVAELIQGCDLLLAPSWEQEGFGLPVLEAMACGVPVLASDIPSYRGFAATAAELLPPRDPRVWADNIPAVLDNPARWRSMRRRGLAAAGGFTEERSAQAAEEALYWALERAEALTGEEFRPSADS